MHIGGADDTFLPMRSLDIVNAFGGYHRLAADLHLAPTTVYTWIEKGISPWRYRDLLDLAEKRGLPEITGNVLIRSEPTPPSDLARRRYIKRDNQAGAL